MGKPVHSRGMTEFLLELALLGVVALLVSSYSYVRWKWKRVSGRGHGPLDYLWQFLYPGFFIVAFTVLVGGIEGLALALVATVVFYFAWGMALDVLVSQEQAEAFFGE